MSSPAASPIQVSPSPPLELRHITSSGALTPQKDANKLSTRTSQHLSHRLGSPSAGSIPSSPTSIHSSSSAIFERDIEPISPSPSQTHANPHRTPRGKFTEQLDQAVPSVLDSAAAVLTSSSSPIDEQNIAIVAPAPDIGSRSGLTSPSSRMSSRSPSPSAMFGHGSAGTRTSAFMNLPSPSPSLTLPLPLNTTSTTISAGAPSPPAPASQSPLARPNLQSTISTQSVSTPQPPGAFNTVSSTPTTATHEHGLPQRRPSTTAAALPPSDGDPTSQIAGSPTQTAVSTVSHPPSPRVANNRLSFISYNDLLTSTPTSTLPLSSFTTSISSDPPPHLPSVLGVPQHMAGSAAGSIHSNPRSSFYGERDVREGREGLLLDDQGGEWEREGLGQGLEERLDKLMGVGAVGLGKA